jgi:hypothetical protein
MCVFHNETHDLYEFHCETKQNYKRSATKPLSSGQVLQTAFKRWAGGLRLTQAGIYLLIMLDLLVAREFSGREFVPPRFNFTGQRSPPGLNSELACFILYLQEYA